MSFVALFTTNNLSAQVCLDSRTLNPVTLQPAQFVCAGDNLLWTTTSIGSSAGLAITWTLVDGTGGAFFVASGTTTYSTVVNAGTPNINSALVTMGPNAGSVTVTMQFDANPNPNSCSSSGIAKVLQVTGTPSVQRCAQDLGSIQATALTNLGFPIGTVSLPPYHFTLNPGGLTNDTGLFSGLAAGVYTVTVTDDDGCTATSGNINLVNPQVVAVNAICPGDVTNNSCFYADQAALDAAVAAWRAGFSFTGGTGVVTETRNEIGAALLCGGTLTINYSVIDECQQVDNCSASFIVTAPAVVNALLPNNREINACDVIDADALRALVDAYRAEFRAEGGCAPRVELDPYVLPNLCDGVINITGRIIDRCNVNIPIARQFIIRPAVALQFEAPNNDIKAACFYQNQAEVVAAFNIWVQGFRIISGGCAPTIEVLPAVIPNFCGGVVTVRAIVRDRCFDQREIAAQFGVADATPPVINNCPPGAQLGCNPIIPVASVLDVTSACPFTTDVQENIVADGCNRTLTRVYVVANGCMVKQDVLKYLIIQ
jgi:hypothetical protein